MRVLRVVPHIANISDISDISNVTNVPPPADIAAVVRQVANISDTLRASILPQIPNISHIPHISHVSQLSRTPPLPSIVAHVPDVSHITHVPDVTNIPNSVLLARIGSRSPEQDRLEKGGHQCRVVALALPARFEGFQHDVSHLDWSVAECLKGGIVHWISFTEGFYIVVVRCLSRHSTGRRLASATGARIWLIVAVVGVVVALCIPATSTFFRFS
mmetsp:Transcript_30104/g.65052  ORF Transcript_30104/g.65052 Transcript_30104/m.65052 type:complete len:216 (-) Transcript_30104:443-1090(-)